MSPQGGHEESGPGRRGARLVLAVGILAGLVYAVTFPRLQPDQVGIATDAYYHAARAILTGGDLYGVRPPDHPRFGFLYPPIVVVAFLPHGLLGDPLLAYGLQTALNLAALAGIGWLSVRTIESAGYRLERVDRLLVYGVAITSVGPVANLVMGQVNPFLAVGIAAGAVLLERDRRGAAGAAFGLVALVKVFPALVGAWLVRRRAWTAVGTAIAAGIAGIAASALAFGPDLTLSFFTEVLVAEAANGVPAGRYDPASELLTVRRQVAFLAPWIPAVWRLPIAGLVLAPVVLAAWRSVEDPVDRLVALEATLLVTLLAFPLEPFYLVLALFPTIPLVYLVEGRWTRRLFLAGVVVASTVVTLVTVRQGLAMVGAPAPLREAVLGGVGPLFAFVLPPTVGVYLLLAGCVLAQWETDAETTAADATRAGESGDREGRDVSSE